MKKAKELSITRASFNLTRACNLACSYCFTNGCTSGSMSKDTAFKGVDFLFENAKNLISGPERMVEISFWGGEPLIEWSLLQDIVLYAKERSARDAVPVHFGGTTNGTLLTPEKFDFLDKHKIFFMVSFDGTKESHDYHRKFKDGRGSHEIVERNIKEALKKWPFYRVRLSPFAQRVDHFAEDMKFVFGLGVEYIVFSPVYESNFTDKHWEIFENECRKVIDYMVELQAQGKKAEVEHFKSYVGKDNSKWPCGAGRTYVGFDTDGAIYPCHRFNKFDDNRPWQEKEVCIGHVEMGITNPNFRNRFIDFAPECGECPRSQDTPCHGGCYAVNFDFTGSIEIPHIGLCMYTNTQKRVSEYYKEKIPMVEAPTGRPCTCNNLCYEEGTDQEIRTIDLTTDATCICNFSNYSGGQTKPPRPLTAKERSAPSITNQDKAALRAIFMDIDRRLTEIEKKLGVGKIGKSN